MYDCNYSCRYHREDVFLETDGANDYEKELIRDYLYKEDILEIFIIENNNIDLLDKSIDDLYDKIKESDELNDIMLVVASKNNTLEPIIGLCILYCFDFMNFTHVCVSEYIKTKQISRENLETLQLTIANKY